MHGPLAVTHIKCRICSEPDNNSLGVFFIAQIHCTPHPQLNFNGFRKLSVQENVSFRRHRKISLDGALTHCLHILAPLLEEWEEMRGKVLVRMMNSDQLGKLGRWKAAL